MSRKRRNWSPEERAAVVLEIIATVFDKKGESIEKVKQEYEADKELLVKKIGELTLDVDYLKKKHNQVSEMRKRKP